MFPLVLRQLIAGVLAVLATVAAAAAGSAHAVVVLVAVAGVASARRALTTDRAQRLAWGLWSVGAALLAVGLFGVRVDAAARGELVIGVAVLVFAWSVWFVTGLRDPRNKVVSVLDALLVAGALATLCLGSRELETRAWFAALCLLVWVVALVRFGLSAGTWLSATVTFMAGNALAVAGLTIWVMGEQRALALLAGAAVLWTAGAVDRSSSATFVPVALGRDQPLRSRGGVLSAVVCLPTASLSLAFAEGRAPSTGLLCSIGVLIVVLAVRVAYAAARGGEGVSTGSVLLAGAVVVVLGSSLGAAAVNATAQRYADQQTALLSYQRALWNSARPLSDAAIGAFDLEQVSEVRRLNDLRLAALPVPPATSARLRVTTSEWIQTLAAVNIELAGNPSRRARDAALLRAGQATNAVVRELRLTNDRAAARETAAARRGRVTIAVVFFCSALIVLLLLRSYSRSERSTTTAEAQRDANAAAKAEMSLLLSAATDLVIVLDEHLCVTTAHGAQIDLVFDDAAIAGRPLSACLDPEFAELGRQQVQALLASTQSTGDATWRLRGVGGATHDVDVRIYDARDRPLLGDVVLAFKDITKRGEIAQALRSTTGLDPLTGLPDRVAAFQAVEVLAQSETPRVGLVKLDLDEFRSVNEQLGTAPGDEILRSVARRLTRAAEGRYVARVGSNAFICVVDGLEAPDLERVARDLLAEATRPFELDGFRPTMVQASVGVAATALPAPPGFAAELFRDAETAMYEAKLEPGNSLRCFDSSPAHATRPRIALRSELVAGIAGGQMLLQYQPIVRPRTADVVGYEALVRWQHPTLGRISPAEFIPIAERTGLIVELGDWVLHEATRQLAEWDPLWPDRRYVTVNVAAQQLEQPDFADRVAHAIEVSGIRPAQLVLEVTESSLITDEIAGAARLTALQNLGVQIAIDDFGTGYSSLNYLNQFAVDIVKLDKSFIDSVAGDPRTRALVAGIASMANGLDLTVVAEGAEEREQVEVLAAIGCQLIQGYHFSRPLDPRDVASFTLRPHPYELREHFGPEAA
ncbi:MAG: phosphodiesterase [Patulibacter minatonensis]